MKEKKFTPKRFGRYSLIAFVTTTVIFAMVYSFYSSSQIINKYAPLVDASMEIKLEATTAHLWFEEIISGDRYENLDNVIKHIDLALWYSDVMLKGGKNQESNFIPLSDQLLKNKIEKISEYLKEFKEITFKRYGAQKTSGVGSEIDQVYDSLYLDIIEKTNIVESLLQEKIRDDFYHYQITQSILIGVTLILSLLGFVIQYRYDLVLNRNITNLNQAKNKAEKSEQWLNTIMDSMGDGVITTDVNGNVTRINPVAEEITGWPLSDAKGLSLKNIFPIYNASTRESIPNPVDKVIATGETVYLSNHTTLISKQGNEYQIADSAAPIRDSDNIILGMVLVFSDVTEKYMIREQLVSNLQRLSLHWKDTPLGMIEWNTDFEFLDLNPAAERMFGYSKAEVQGQHITKNILPDMAKESVDKVWGELLANTGGRRSTNKNITKKGKTILCEWYNTPLINQDGEVIGVSSLIMDITEQERLKVQEQVGKHQLQQVMDGMLTMVFNLLPDGTLIFINKSALSILGTTEANILGKKFWDCPWFSAKKSNQQIIYNACVAVNDGEPINHELEIIGPDGIIWVDIIIHSVLDSHGNIKMLVSEVIDISDRKLAIAHVIRNQKMSALSKVVGGIAHDYNNMLGVITGYSGLLKRKCVDVEGADKFINEIINASNRGKKLTQKMLNFSRPESNLSEYCNINQTLDGFYDMLTKSLTATIKLQINLSKESWLTWIDHNELEDAILNLAINAKYAMPEGGSLTISTQNINLTEKEAQFINLSANEYIKLMVMDTGIGIAEDIQDKVFDPFFTSKGKAGNGLGLSQVFAFMERAGGAVKLYSKEGEGAQFYLYFPRFQKSNVIEKKTIIELQPQVLGDETILVVDDEPALRELASEMLINAGYKVFIAVDGKDALEVLATEKAIALVLSDIIMPNMDGYQLAQQIMDNYPNVKIQLTSGYTGESQSILQDSQLKDNILYKPYDTDELLNKVRATLDC